MQPCKCGKKVCRYICEKKFMHLYELLADVKVMYLPRKYCTNTNQKYEYKIVDNECL